MAPHLYLRFRKNDVMELANGYVRNAVREAFNLVASQMPVQNIYGVDKAKVVLDVTKRLQEQLGKDGFVIDQLTINGALRLPENVANAINRAMEATQQAIQAENRVRQVRAEAEQAITEAEGLASAARARAKGEADARLTTAKAEAKANLILRYSTSGSVLQYRALEKWNGKLPIMNGGGALPLLTFDVSKIGKGDDADEKRLRALLAQEEEDEGKAKADKEKKDEAPKADQAEKDKPKGDKKDAPPAAPAPPKP
jgi:regulator of protease activity HflC (stomatin/prohibitin superfamily)